MRTRGGRRSKIKKFVDIINGSPIHRYLCSGRCVASGAAAAAAAAMVIITYYAAHIEIVLLSLALAAERAREVCESLLPP